MVGAYIRYRVRSSFSPHTRESQLPPHICALSSKYLFTVHVISKGLQQALQICFWLPVWYNSFGLLVIIVNSDGLTSIPLRNLPSQDFNSYNAVHVEAWGDPVWICTCCQDKLQYVAALCGEYFVLILEYFVPYDAPPSVDQARSSNLHVHRDRPTTSLWRVHVVDA